MHLFILLIAMIMVLSLVITPAHTIAQSMTKPSFESLENWDAIKNGYNKERSTKFTATPEQIKELKNWGCDKNVKIFDGYNVSEEKTYSLTQLQNGITFTSRYQWQWFGQTFLPHQENLLRTRGWFVFEPDENSTLTNASMDYTQPADTLSESNKYETERNGVMASIWWEKEEYKRYPYNTLFLTTDTLMHTYYKLFSNHLQEWEESNAREVIASLVASQFEETKKLYNAEKSPTTKKIYGFLMAYWALPHSVLIPQKTLLDYYTDTWEDMTADEITKEITNRSKKIIAQLPQDIQERAQMALKNMLDGSISDWSQDLMEYFGPINDDVAIFQDYTQFVPRSHYTRSSLLRTYFIAMKSLMRHKFYYSRPELAHAALLLAHNLQGSQWQSFQDFHKAITYLIGDDDDTTIADLKWFWEKQWRKNPSTISIDQNIITELSKLRPQKIISTSYLAPWMQTVTEKEAKQQTDWFVVFGEKFTLDSWLFDLMTAGEAEKESEYKMPKQTAMIIPAILDPNDVFARGAVGAWMKKNNATPQQLSYWITAWYQADVDAMTKTLDLNKNIYSQWLQTLTFAKTPRKNSNQPYFQNDFWYKVKELNTMMGSYAELKHATLLYVKQAYAEVGGWWNSCVIDILPPSLPVPKGYIEPNVVLMEKLLLLIQNTNAFFKSDRFFEFEKVMNDVISLTKKQVAGIQRTDQEFESLRLMYDRLSLLLSKQKLIGQPLLKERRTSIIADIFNSENDWPLYVWLGKPMIIAVAINDQNGSRVVLGPIYRYQEFYDNNPHIKPKAGRLTDDERQEKIPTLTKAQHRDLLGVPLKALINLR